MTGFDNPGTDPYTLFGKWFEDAKDSEINDPNAMCVSSVDNSGYPDSRMVLMKDFDVTGFVFYTNYTSRKGQQLLAHPKAAACFHWKSLRRQVRISGDVEQVSDAEADEYFASRPKGSRLGAHASNQSSPLDSRETLANKVAELEDYYKDSDDIPRPAHWSGFRIKPKRIEFWQDGEFRLHDRFEFTRDADGNWISQRLYP
jgi:pyridoxamine 5'-phosphate oxidase